MKRGTLALSLSLALGAALVGVWGSEYTLLTLFTLSLNIVMACSYNLFSGYSGMINLGHGLFFGVGGYACAILTIAGYPRFVCVPAAGLAAMAAAALIGPFALPLSRASFSMVTLGIVFIFERAAGNLEQWTGGAAGLSVFPGIDAAWAASLMGALALLTTLGNIVMKTSKMGYGLIALREHEQTALLSGCDAFGLPYAALLLSAPAAGLAGALAVLHMAYISPSSALSLELTLAPVVMVMVGGPGTFWGPVVGAAALTLWQEALWIWVDRFPLAIYGATLLAVGVFLPRGLAGMRFPAFSYFRRFRKSVPLRRKTR